MKLQGSFLLDQFWYQLPRVHGQPLADVALRAEPTAFVVTEHLDIPFTGSGEHLWLYIKKTGANTTWVAKQLADYLAVPVNAVAYSGLKDRNAVTYQWFSVQLPVADEPDFSNWQLAEVSVEKTVRHQRKLKTGTHQSNQFSIRLDFPQPVPAELQTKLETRWQQIIGQGVPNYFGEQRFGRDGSNLDKLDDFLSGKKRNRNRDQRSMLYSAARSALFNLSLATKVTGNMWNALSSGDKAMLHGSNSVFTADNNEIERLAAWDIHPVTMLPGVSGELSDIEEVELQQLSDYSAWLKGLRKAKVQMHRRSNRLKPESASYQWLNNQQWQLNFTLPTGSFATAILRELVDW